VQSHLAGRLAPRGLVVHLHFAKVLRADCTNPKARRRPKFAAGRLPFRGTVGAVARAPCPTSPLSSPPRRSSGFASCTSALASAS